MFTKFTKIIFFIIGLLNVASPMMGYCSSEEQGWQLGSFKRVDELNPILKPLADSLFYCPVQKKNVCWESKHTFNPAAVVRNGKVYLFYRAEDEYGDGIGMHTSRLGLAVSEDGINFKRKKKPVFFPKLDNQMSHEFPGGCEDPRIVETEKGTYVMTYTQWNRKIAVLGIATSRDLIHWKKHGYAFKRSLKGKRTWSKSGSIVCRRKGDRLIATKIQGKYWMYCGEGQVNIATSDDLISWDYVSKNGTPIAVLETRSEKFDSSLVECGPPAILTQDGIILLYNGKNALENGDPLIRPNSYSA